jgi:dTDP-4-amino-4,6-dideoxygalactose transaminase
VIPYSRQSISKKDVSSVTKVLQSSFLTKGPVVKKFETTIKKKFSSKYAVCSNSGSSSLHLACLAVGIKTGDIVWTVPITYAASANCAINCGAKIDFVDICPETFNISVKKLEEKLITAKKKNKLPKLIIPVHLAGQPYEQKEIWKLSKKYKFKIIEDASHAIGAKHYGENVGSCKWSDITVFSFHPVKIITTAEGGAALTNNKIYFEKMLQFR